MRPQEILGMVEEAAGTRMFEERKDKAQKTMAKKEKRVQEILSLLEEEITPKLEKLRLEKRSFLAYRKSVSELEKIARVLRAWEWKRGQEKVLEKEEEIQAKRADIKQIRCNKERAIKETEAAEKDVVDVTKKRDAEISKGGKMKKLEEEVDSLGKTLVKIKTQADLKKSTIKDEEGNIKVLNDELEEVGQVDMSQKQYPTKLPTPSSCRH
ncbi:hypothetical protein BDZ94DRAFT_136374 [Collybia nuda]|uniref:Uncharacterized protein n=1 Tax=Collybia nuda TaxID=64659 RepID=A0A9P6CHZ7_9AGAR|nr:hypothetical protein BDZ94DRAFT_136374 [Collybia nuda]